MPHKQAALALADEPTPRARAIGAANTLIFGDDGAIRADNTDAPALIAALPFAPPAGRRWCSAPAEAPAPRCGRCSTPGRPTCGCGTARPSAPERCAQSWAARPSQRVEPADLLVHCTSIGLDVQAIFRSSSCRSSADDLDHVSLRGRSRVQGI